jgi:hypothetical protein
MHLSIVVPVSLALLVGAISSVYVYYRLCKSKKPNALSKRQRVMNEILATERVYVKGLQQLRDYLIEPLKSRTKEGREEQQKNRLRKFALAKKQFDEQGIPVKIYRKIYKVKEPELEIVPETSDPQVIDIKKIKELFGPIQIIFGVNETFLGALEDIMREEKPVPFWRRKFVKSQPKHTFYKEEQLANFLLSFAHAFKLYSEFITKFNTINPAIKKEKLENEAFKNFLNTQSQAIQKVNGNVNDAHTVDSYMIGPIQRICRYKMLMEELGKCMDKEGSTDPRDKETSVKLEKATTLIAEIADFCNKKTREMENLMRVAEIQRELGLKDLVQAHRRLVKETSAKSEMTCQMPNSESTSSFSLMSYLWSSTEKSIPCNLHVFNDMLILARKHLKSSSSRVTESRILLRLNTGDDQQLKTVSKDVLMTPNSPSRTSARLKEGEDSKYVFVIVHEDVERATIICSNEKERDEWVKALE